VSLLDKKGDSAGSVSILEKAYSLTPFDVELNYMLALKYAESKNSKVLSLCDSLIKKDSLSIHAEPYYYKGIYYSNIHDKTKALNMFNSAIQHDYYFLDAYIEKGAILFEQKKFNEAIDVLRQLIALKPGDAVAPNNMGEAYLELNKLPEAQESFRQAIRLKPDFGKAYYNLGKCLLAMGNRDGALEQYNILMNIDADWAEKLEALINP